MAELLKKNVFQRFVFNFKAGKVRYETLEGRSYAVVPTVMKVEGVHNGSHGPLYYSAEELAKNPAGVWDHKPLVAGHPVGNDGKPLLANSASVIEAYRIGMLLNSSWDGKLRTESWVDVEKASKIAPQVLEAIKNEQTLEVSTGIFTTNDFDGHRESDPA